jgi:hypothetical protein
MSADSPIHHPLWGGPALGGMKAMFRMMNALPPVKRRMAQSQVRLRDRRQHPALVAVGV